VPWFDISLAFPIFHFHALMDYHRLQLDLEAVGVQLLERVAAVKEGLSKKAFLQQAAWEVIFFLSKKRSID
jgi:hypothetical protein